MKHGFTLHTKDTAPPEAATLLEQAEANLGALPNLERVMAECPPLLAGYVDLWELFDETPLPPIERQVVYLTANYENNCTYCVPWHTYLAEQANCPPEVIHALRNNTVIEDKKLEALHAFTRILIEQRGQATDEQTQAFFAAGYTKMHALAVVLGLSVKLMSNYTNSIAGTPLDEAMQSRAWQKPE